MSNGSKDPTPVSRSASPAVHRQYAEEGKKNRKKEKRKKKKPKEKREGKHTGTCLRDKGPDGSYATLRASQGPVSQETGPSTICPAAGPAKQKKKKKEEKRKRRKNSWKKPLRNATALEKMRAKRKTFSREIRSREVHQLAEKPGYPMT